MYLPQNITMLLAKIAQVIFFPLKGGVYTLMLLLLLCLFYASVPAFSIPPTSYPLLVLAASSPTALALADYFPDILTSLKSDHLSPIFRSL